jgi:hypothetical protein
MANTGFRRGVPGSAFFFPQRMSALFAAFRRTLAGACGDSHRSTVQIRWHQLLKLLLNVLEC